MNEMALWMTNIVNLLRPFFASNGGPIILAQVENEYGMTDTVTNSIVLLPLVYQL